MASWESMWAPTPPGDFENSLAVAIIAQCSMALEKNIFPGSGGGSGHGPGRTASSNLLRSISHDLRTPLTSISGNAGVLMSDGGEPCRPNTVPDIQGHIR